MQTPKISNNKPPHFWIMKLVFDPNWERTAFAFGNTIYAKYELPDHLIVHEDTHLKQQGRNIIGAWIWLFFYLVSKSFRYKMELQAYRAQWQYFKKTYPYREHEAFLKKISSDLSGSLYGNVTTESEARKQITS